ncbi:MAG: magnesium-protoporphyrin IX monomethyl ester (oxidative) cyclase [Rhodospirillaceae bacterium]|nr:magnesium-protoporphyrin IX monomethyl ester (oxidative) cyclase [Rhodospirillaceae bacterium]
MTTQKAQTATTEMALTENVLSPRFYTTDFAALDRIDVSPVRAEWDALMAELEADTNRDHFRDPPKFGRAALDALPADLRGEFVDFLVSSLTAEFSGCLLYAEIAKRVTNPDMQAVFKYMARDESRHAGFINEILKDLEIPVDMSFLSKNKAVTYFKPKYIFYATYLSEKIGYARYITIYRQFERHPELRFHPIFKWFQEWCNDEFRHGEVYALIMRANPHLLSGLNTFWVRFFLVSVYATMYVRDHSRPALYRAFGMPPAEYGYRVFNVCTEITRQVFPVTLDTDSPRFRALMDRLREGFAAMAEAKARGGALAGLKRIGIAAGIAATCLQLYLVPVKSNALPARILMAPSW